MSVVANILCPFASWVAYDGRASRNGEIISESTDKAVMINSSVCVSYTGSLELAELVILNLREHVVGISGMKCDTVAQAIKLLLPNLKAPSGVFSDFLVTGINSSGLMASYTLGSNHELCMYVPHEDEVKVSVLHSLRNTLDLSPYLSKHIQQAGFCEFSVKSALREYIVDVAKIDPSVNRYCQILELRK